MISVLGVPGYPDAKRTPCSYAPLAIASFPDINDFIGSTSPELIKPFSLKWKNYTPATIYVTAVITMKIYLLTPFSKGGRGVLSPSGGGAGGGFPLSKSL
jgi:hypothetical protein